MLRKQAVKNSVIFAGTTLTEGSGEFEGAEYNEPPRAMIINAIMKAVYGNSGASAPEAGEYILPVNLKTFFKGVK